MVIVDFEGNIVEGAFRPTSDTLHSRGPFAWGSSAPKAVENAQALEIIAEMARRTLQLNPAAPQIPQHLLDKHFNRKHGPAAYYGQK